MVQSRNPFSNLLNNDTENTNFINENSYTISIDDNNTTEERSNNHGGNSSSNGASSNCNNSSSGKGGSIKNWFEFLVMPSTNEILDCFLYGDDNDINNLILRYPKVCTVPYSFNTNGNDNSSTATSSSSAANKVSEPLYPLAIVCRRPKETLMETIIAIYNIYPDAIHLNPTLHYSCGVTTRRRRRVNRQEQEQEQRRRRLSLDIIKFLVSKYPNSVTKVENGFLPLHVACAASYGDSSNASYDIINYLIQCYPNGIQQPIESAKCTSSNISSNKLPLHIAIESKASINIVQLLVSKYPKALQIPDYEFESIEYEYSSQYSKQMQLQSYQQEEQENGCWIIRKRIGRNSSSPIATSSSSSSSSSDSDNDNDSAINNGIERQQLQQQQLQQRQEMHNDGCGLPLHLACKNINNFNDNETTFQVVNHLIQLYPDALITKNYNGWLPIHFACHSTQTSLSLIDLLVTNCPNSIVHCTNKSRYPLDMIFTNMIRGRGKRNTTTNNDNNSGNNHNSDADNSTNDVMQMKIKYILSKHDANFVLSKVSQYLREEMHNAERSLAVLSKSSASSSLQYNTATCGITEASSNTRTANNMHSTNRMHIRTHK